MRRWLKISGLGALALAVLVLAAAVGIDRLLATEVLFISPKADDVVKVERALWEPGQPVAPIYGAPASQAARVVLVDESRLIRPAEDSKLLLLKVDKQRGENPLQVKTVWFIALRAAAGLLLFAALALVASRWLGRRERHALQAAV